MNEFQKRALAYNAYRALRKLAAAQNKQNGTTAPNMAAGASDGASEDKLTAPKELKGPVIRTKRDWWNRIPKRSSGKGGKGCC